SQPVMVEVSIGSAVALASAAPNDREPLVQKMLAQVQAAITTHPGSLITLRLADAPFAFDDLPEAVRHEIANSGTEGKADARYERAVSAVLDSVVAQARMAKDDLRIAVYGLPV